MFSFCFLTLGVTQVPLLVYRTLSGLLLVLDVTGKPNFISRYRIHVDNNGRVSVAAASAGWSTESRG